MSKIIDSLKKAEAKKNGNSHSQPPGKENPAGADEPIIQSALEKTGNDYEKTHRPPQTVAARQPVKTSPIPITVIIIGFILLLGVNLALMNILRDYRRSNTNAIAKLNRIEEALNKNNLQFS